MAKVVINTCYGGFRLSQRALKRLRAEGVEVLTDGYHTDEVLYLGQVERHDPRLVAVVEEMDEAPLEVVEVGPVYRIVEYDGLEHVEEPHTIQWVTVE